MQNKEQDQVDVAIERILEAAVQHCRDGESPNIMMKPCQIEAIMERTAALIKPLIDLKVYQLEHSLTRTIRILKNARRIKVVR